jgi:hypothetical protein
VQHPTLEQSILDCLELCREQQREVTRSRCLPLPLVRLEFRLLYLLHFYCPSRSLRSAQETTRYLELNRLLNPKLEDLPRLPDNPPPFDKWEQSRSR